VLPLLGGTLGREGRRHLDRRVRRVLRGGYGAQWLLSTRSSLALCGFRGGLKHATYLSPGDRGRRAQRTLAACRTGVVVIAIALAMCTWLWPRRLWPCGGTSSGASHEAPARRAHSPGENKRTVLDARRFFRTNEALY
jgi:hypothetical protein